MRTRALWREVRALGVKRSLELGFYKVRRQLERRAGITARRQRGAALADDEWRRGLGALSPAAAGAQFRSGVAGLGWGIVTARDATLDCLRASEPAHVAALVAAAERICTGEIELFGRWRRIVSANGRVDWQRDWLGDHVWPAHAPSWALPIGSEPGADPKVPWEVGRSLHLVTLAQAYALDPRRQFADAIAQQITDFIEHNPVGMGIQWASTMDVAIRACNWLLAWDLIRTADAGSALAVPLLRSLVEHGRFIERNLENRDGINSNHYLADLAGLAYLSRLESVWPQASRWKHIWLSESQREIQRQVLPDGFTFEAAVAYHRLALELLTYPLVVADGKPRVGPAYLQRIRSMVDAVAVYSSRTGQCPRFGDDDGGRLHRLHPRDDADHSYLTALAAGVATGRSTAGVPESIWMFGPTPDPAPRPVPPRAGAEMLPDGGLVTLRDHDSELMFTCGPNGQRGRGGHAHNDKLSFVLFVAGTPGIVDPGTFVYTRDVALRQRFRSTASHSTIMVGGQEQNRTSFLSAFRLLPDADPRGLALAKRDGGLWVLQGSHSGYERSPLHLTHSRRISHRESSGEWIILDVLTPLAQRSGREPIPFLLTLPLAPGSRALREGSTWSVSFPGGAGVLVDTVFRGCEGRWEIEAESVSPTYGVRVPAPFLRLRGLLLPRAPYHALRTRLRVRS